MDHFTLPLLLKDFQQFGSYFPHPALEGADLQWLIAPWGEALELPEYVSIAALGIGLEPGGDPLPLSLERVIAGTPPAKDAFSLLLLLVQDG